MTESSPPGQRFYEIDHLLTAYARSGSTFSDTAEVPGPGLTSYLRVVARDPARGATAVQQIDDLLAVGLFAEEIADEVDPLPRIQPPAGMSVEDCLRIARDHIYRVLQEPSQVQRVNPQNRWEWKETFPFLSQLLGAYFGQDFPDWYATWEEAIDDYLGDMGGEEARHTAEEVTEFLTIVESDQELKQATHILGLELLPPRGMTLRRWLESMRHRITSTT
ncbi:contact-dependent growth inhibition system immunity protein [Streptomyces fulvoviolaceus]|uniref:contact-dependent growth inhibition system immunity protein n=1 Tax=Streptomyces fulvoviolaceus TaxID=285535 RepID=UPI0021BFE87E|nr:contact-dependent growth inhibition system immunity protein [Streptomyces fulvoviolaceus]MCT9077220.1 contact-dependent growth inhibition system immunity protein [Streptomyces fulvoviolaceus]